MKGISLKELISFMTIEANIRSAMETACWSQSNWLTAVKWYQSAPSSEGFGNVVIFTRLLCWACNRRVLETGDCRDHGKFSRISWPDKWMKSVDPILCRQNITSFTAILHCLFMNQVWNGLVSSIDVKWSCSLDLCLCFASFVCINWTNPLSDKFLDNISSIERNNTLLVRDVVGNVLFHKHMGWTVVKQQFQKLIISEICLQITTGDSTVVFNVLTRARSGIGGIMKPMTLLQVNIFHAEYKNVPWLMATLCGEMHTLGSLKDAVNREFGASVCHIHDEFACWRTVWIERVQKTEFPGVHE